MNQRRHVAQLMGRIEYRRDDRCVTEEGHARRISDRVGLGDAALTNLFGEGLESLGPPVLLDLRETRLHQFLREMVSSLLVHRPEYLG